MLLFINEFIGIHLFTGFFSPEEIAEFLDSWLMLIERMSNPKTILETPHVMPSKSSQTGYVPFSAVQYLIKAQKVGAPSL